MFGRRKKDETSFIASSQVKRNTARGKKINGQINNGQTSVFKVNNKGNPNTQQVALRFGEGRKNPSVSDRGIARPTGSSVSVDSSIGGSRAKKGRNQTNIWSDVDTASVVSTGSASNKRYSNGRQISVTNNASKPLPRTASVESVGSSKPANPLVNRMLTPEDAINYWTDAEARRRVNSFTSHRVPKAAEKRSTKQGTRGVSRYAGLEAPERIESVVVSSNNSPSSVPPSPITPSNERGRSASITTAPLDFGRLSLTKASVADMANQVPNLLPPPPPEEAAILPPPPLASSMANAVNNKSNKSIKNSPAPSDIRKKKPSKNVRVRHSNKRVVGDEEEISDRNLYKMERTATAMTGGSLGTDLDEDDMTYIDYTVVPLLLRAGVDYALSNRLGHLLKLRYNKEMILEAMNNPFSFFAVLEQEGIVLDKNERLAIVDDEYWKTSGARGDERKGTHKSFVYHRAAENSKNTMRQSVDSRTSKTSSILKRDKRVAIKNEFGQERSLRADEAPDAPFEIDFDEVRRSLRIMSESMTNNKKDNNSPHI